MNPICSFPKEWPVRSLALKEPVKLRRLRRQPVKMIPGDRPGRFWERSIYPHPKIPQALRHGPLPDVLWLDFEGTCLLGYRKQLPSLKHAKA